MKRGVRNLDAQLHPSGAFFDGYRGKVYSCEDWEGGRLPPSLALRRCRQGMEGGYLNILTFTLMSFFGILQDKVRVWRCVLSNPPALESLPGFCYFKGCESAIRPSTSQIYGMTQCATTSGLDGRELHEYVRALERWSLPQVR